MKKIIFLLTLLFTLKKATANALYPVDINEKIVNATNIIEGKVVAQTSFWNATHNFIFTSNKIKVYKIFKGDVATDYVEVITQGGTIDDITMTASDLLSLDINEIAVFFLLPNSLNLRSPLTNKILMDVYSSSQGCFVYDIANKKAVAPFVNYNNITESLYSELQQKIGSSFVVKDASFNLNTASFGAGVLSTPDITSFSPTTVNAGAYLSPSTNILTINGTGFGTASGSAAVLFSDGNTGSISQTYVVNSTDNSIVSWTPTQIKVKVPSRAATGYFSVRESTGVVGQSIDFINVYYSILTTQVGSALKEMNLMNQNTTGGYTVYFSNSTDGGALDLDGSSTKATVQRALTTWKEIVGMNWPEGGATAAQFIAPSDIQNIIMYDNTNTGVSPLPAGVLAVCYSSASGCTGREGQKLGFDVIIRNAGVSVGSASFTVGPCQPSTSQIDLETVVLHELGHAISLGHINDGLQGGAPNANTGKLMHYAVSNGVKRTTPDGSAYNGALYLCNAQGNSYGTCQYLSEMTQLSFTAVANDDCPASFPTIATETGTVVTFDLVHATSNSLVDPQYTEIKCTGVGTAVTNNQYYPLKTLNSGILSLTVSDYTTTPSGLNSCASKGVELALFQVATCPDGQNYPSPVASSCRSFTGNGAIANITGLLPNTEYLLFADGVANTKATFKLTFTGSALPIKLSSFYGEVLNNFNQIYWTAQVITNTKKIIIEKSANGINFDYIGELTGDNALKPSNKFTDYSPFVANNYYRLCVVSNTGEKEYSNIILLKRKDKFLFTVSPNPTKDAINIQMFTDFTDTYQISVFDILGKIVSSKRIATNTNLLKTTLDISNVSNGVYQLIVTDKYQNKVARQSIVVAK